MRVTLSKLLRQRLVTLLFAVAVASSTLIYCLPSRDLYLKERVTREFIEKTIAAIAVVPEGLSFENFAVAARLLKSHYDVLKGKLEGIDASLHEEHVVPVALRSGSGVEVRVLCSIVRLGGEFDLLLKAGSLLSDSLLLDAETLARLGVRIGSEVELVSDYLSGRFKVSGIFDSEYRRGIVKAILVAGRVASPRSPVKILWVVPRSIESAEEVHAKVLEAVAGTLFSAKSRVYALRDFRAYLDSIAAQKSFLQLLSIVAAVASTSLVTVMALILDERNTLTLMVFGWSWRGIALVNALHSVLTALWVLSIVVALFALMGFPLAELAVLGALLLLSVSVTVMAVSALLLYWMRYRVFEVFKV